MKKLSVCEPYVVVTENNGCIEASIWCDDLIIARKEAKEIRQGCSSEEKSSVLILKVLKL